MPQLVLYVIHPRAFIWRARRGCTISSMWGRGLSTHVYNICRVDSAPKVAAVVTKCSVINSTLIFNGPLRRLCVCVCVCERESCRSVPPRRCQIQRTTHHAPSDTADVSQSARLRSCASIMHGSMNSRILITSISNISNISSITLTTQFELTATNPRLRNT